MIYYRTVTKREIINRFGKVGFIPYLIMVDTDDIDPYNYRLRNKFQEVKDKVLLEEFMDNCGEFDTIYERRLNANEYL